MILKKQIVDWVIINKHNLLPVKAKQDFSDLHLFDLAETPTSQIPRLSICIAGGSCTKHAA